MEKKEQPYIFFKFQLHKGYVPLYEWIILQIYCVKLITKRFLRLGKRISIYLKKYIPIIICVIGFELIVIPLGMHLGKYTSWVDGFWDLRNFMLTSIIISVFTGVLNMEITRHKKLVEQYWAYQDFKFSSKEFVKSLCGIANVNVEMDMFLSEEQYDLYQETLVKEIENSQNGIKFEVVDCKKLFGCEKKLSRQKAIILIFEQYYRELVNLNKTLLLSEFEGSIEHAMQQIDYIYNELKVEEFILEENKKGYTDKDLLKFSLGIAGTIYCAIADIRRPWRWDIVINQKMDEIINVYKK